MTPDPVSLLVDVDLDHPRGGEALHLLADATFRRDFSPRVGSSTLAMTWLAAGRRAAYVHEGDLRDNVHFAAPIAIAQAAGCVVTGIHGQPLHTEPHGLLAAADAATHARLLAARHGRWLNVHLGFRPPSPAGRAAPSTLGA